jgi:prepilin-type N-terminal cleavage/methylation domain-containing protein
MEQEHMVTKQPSNKRGVRGLTLVEILVAIVVFSIFAVGLLPLATGASLLRQQQQLIAEATDLAQIQLEETRRYWSQLNPSTAVKAVNYTPGLLPLFGEIDKDDCSLKRTGTQPQEVTQALLTNPSNVPVNDAGIVNYAVQENLAVATINAGGVSCIYRDSEAAVNKSKPVRFIAQLFWGDQDNDGNGVADPSPNSSRRIVVRIYRAIGTGTTCTAANCVPACVATPANCLPIGATTQTAFPVFTGNASVLDNRAALVVLTADIAEPT